MFGYSHMTGGYPGGQAEYVRVPYADVNCMPVPDELDDEHVLFLTDAGATVEPYLCDKPIDFDRDITPLYLVM